MSGFGPPRFPHRPRGPFSFDDPRIPPLNPPPRPFSPNLRPNFSHGGRSLGFVHSGAGGRYATSYGQNRPSFSNRGRGKGYHGNEDRSLDQIQGVKAYYKHSMVEDPWKELEENLGKQKQKQSEHDNKMNQC